MRKNIGSVNGLILLIFSLAYGLRIFHLNARGLWVDELFTAVFSLPDFSYREIFEKAIATPIPSPPLIFWVTHEFVKYFGVSETVIRMPSILAGILGVAAVYGFGKRLFSTEAGVIAAVLMAVSPYHIHYSREARYYSFFALFALLCIWFLFEALNSNAWKWWGLYTVAAVLMIYSHLFGMFILIAQAFYIGILVVANKETEKKGWAHLLPPYVLNYLGSALLIALAFSPMVKPLLASSTGYRGLGAEIPVEGVKFDLRFFLGMFAEFGAGMGIPLTFFLSGAIWGLLVNYKGKSREMLFLISILFIPFVLVYLIRPKHWFDLKYVIYILPIYLVFVSTGIASLGDMFTELGGLKFNGSKIGGRYLLTSLLVAGFAWMSMQKLPEAYIQRNDYWGQKVNFVNINVQPNDIVVGLQENEFFEFYFDPVHSKQEDLVVTDTVNGLKILVDQYERVWFHSFREENYPDIMEWINTQPHVVFNFHVGDMYYLGKNTSQQELLLEAEKLHLPTFEIAHSVIRGFDEVGEHEYALDLYQKVINNYPDNHQAKYYLGGMYKLMGYSSPAVKSYLSAASDMPEIIAYQAAAADVSLSVGNYELANYRLGQAVHLWDSNYRFATGVINKLVIDSWRMILEDIQKRGEP
ncbi:MAG: glycosyltransferase family 39 protein [Candidatus Heimdallarchaeota archaeon]|nr:glycosyltransferase family 39 protein [Anaerolineae bacterium]MDH5645676.1 glycosyltransferase family 39 protein [Candidatus Heimdallarchaeota archaeon]